MDGDPAPLVLFAYKRPEHTLRTLEALAANPLAEDSHLTIYCDGPKRPAEAAAVAEVRAVVRRRLWCERVTVIERDRNLGLARSVQTGVSEMLEEHETVIVLEDDIVVAPRFLDFMNHALFHYRNKPRVMQISGYMFPVIVPDDPLTFFLPLISSWGWATWRRAWRPCHPDLPGYDVLANDRALRRRFDLDGAYPFFALLQKQQAGLIDSWAVGWYLSVFQRGGLTLFPGRSYVRNIGWDGSGTHCGQNRAFDTELSERVIKHWPQNITRHEPAFAELRAYFQRLHRQPSGAGRFLTRLQRLFARRAG